MDFGEALTNLKAGKRVAREGWNGKGMFLWFVEADNWHIEEGFAHMASTEFLPWIGMKTADNKFVPWLASQTDMLAMDWTVL
jgi:hypothetical protein